MNVTDVTDVLADLLAEQQTLDDIVAELDADQWRLPTPSPGWTIADQIGHLTYFDGTAALAVVDPPAFQDAMASLLSSGGAGAESADDIVLGKYRSMSPDELLTAWRDNRRALAAAGETLENATRVAWYGPSMGAKSFLTARLMEVWAHGQDIVDAVSATREPTDRLRHIAQLGFITRGWTYLNRGLDVPSTPVRVELTSPSGDTWSFGPDPLTIRPPSRSSGRRSTSASSPRSAATSTTPTLSSPAPPPATGWRRPSSSPAPHPTARHPVGGTRDRPRVGR